MGQDYSINRARLSQIEKSNDEKYFAIGHHKIEEGEVNFSSWYVLIITTLANYNFY